MSPTSHPNFQGSLEQTALHAPWTTGRQVGVRKVRARLSSGVEAPKFGDGLDPVRTAIRMRTEAEPVFMGLWVPESGMRDFRDAHPGASVRPAAD